MANGLASLPFSLMALEILATVCAGLFAGAAIHITAVEHPARLGCGTALALREFAPSYRRATVMQASLAVVGLLAAVGAWWRAGGVRLSAATTPRIARARSPSATTNPERRHIAGRPTLEAKSFQARVIC